MKIDLIFIFRAVGYTLVLLGAVFGFLYLIIFWQEYLSWFLCLVLASWLGFTMADLNR